MAHYFLMRVGERIWIPQSDLCDGYAIDYMEKHKLGRITYNFEEDIIASAKTICKRYKGNQAHAEYLEQMAGKFFDLLQKYHGLGERERLLLRLAAILHDCGKFISMSAPGECAYQIIMSTEILGISHMEREMVASIVRYNTMELPNFN
ncbi:MAG: HD domain-containing protein, partial [Lachnospiraceae bacterium]